MMPTIEKDFSIRLARNLSLAVILVSLTPLLLLSGLTAYYFHYIYKANVLAHLKDIVCRHQQNIDWFLQEKVTDVSMLALSAPLERLADKSFLALLLNELQSRHGAVFVDLGLIDAAGQQKAYAGPYQLDAAQYHQADWFKDLQTRESVISDVFLGLRGQPHFVVAVRFVHQNAHWILRATIDFGSFNRLVGALHEGATGQAFILNRRGEFQTSSQFELNEQDRTMLAIAPTLPQANGPADAPLIPYGLAGPEAVAVSEDKDAEFVLLAAPLVARDWVLFFRQSAADAFRDLYRQRNISIGVVVLGALANMGMGVLLASRIVGQMEKAEEEKQKMQEKMVEADKMASIGELVSGMAHEINNPVAVMIEEAGWVEDLLEEGAEKLDLNLAEIHRALKQIRTQGMRCRDITGKLLSFARRAAPEPEPVQLNTLIQEVTALTAQKVKFGNIQLVVDLAQDLPEVEASLSEMQQIVLNLVNNALYAMEKTGGTLRLATRAAFGVVTVEVSDSGHGIPKEIQNRIFDPFFTTKPVGKGTGLGLSICYGIVKNMGGEITLHSQEGRGATFVIELPAAPAHDQAEEPTLG